MVTIMRINPGKQNSTPDSTEDEGALELGHGAPLDGEKCESGDE